MRYILFILILQFANCELKAQMVTQPGIRDIQITGHTLPDSILFILGTDTLDGSAKQGLAKFYRADSLIDAIVGAIAGDTDWLKLDGVTIPTNADSAKRSGYTLFTGLDGGLPTKIEMLKEGILQFDKTGLYNSPAWLLRSNPLQNAHGVDPFGIVAFAGDNTGGDRKNDTYSIGINPSSIYDGTALYLSMEGHYQPTASDSAHEFHLVMRDILDNDRRIWTWFLPKDDPEGYTQSSYVQQFNLRDPNSITGDGLFFQSIRLNDEESSMRLLGSGSSTGGGAEGIEQFLHTGTGVEQFVIKPFGSMTSDVEMYVNQFNAFNIKRARISDDWGTLHGSDGNPAYLFGGESLYGGVVRVSWDEAIDSLIGNGINLTQNDWYKIGTTDAPTAITDNRYFTGNLAIGATTARGLLDVDNIYIGVNGVSHGYIRSADGMYFNTDYDNNGGDGSFHIQNSGTDVLALDDNGAIDANAYDGTPPTGTPFGILTHESDGDVISSDAGWGLSFSGGNVIADSSQVATQYDLTQTGIQSVEGVSNDGGNVDFVEGWGIDITGDDGANTVTYQVDSAQVATQYDLTQVTGVADGNGIYDAANEGDTAEVVIIKITDADGIYFDALSVANQSYFGYEPSSGRPIVYSDRADDVLYMQNVHASQGTFIGLQSPGNGYKIGAAHGGDFYIQDGTIEPFYIEASTTVDNTLKLQSDGDVEIADYPNSRDDGSPTNFLGTNASGVIQSYPVADVGEMDNWLLAASGTGGTETVTNGETVTFNESTGLDVTRSTNNITTTIDISEYTPDAAIEADESALVYDASGANHEIVDVSEFLNTIEEGNVSVQSDNMHIDFQTLFDLAADGAEEVNVSLDLSESTTVTSVESDDYVIMHDAGSSQHQKILWSDIHNDVISFYDGTVLQGTGNAIDVGEGIDINMVSTEANINLDASEFQIDGTGEGTEYVLIHDIDTTAGHQIQRRLVSSFGGADGNGIYDGDGTVPSDLDATLTDNARFGDGSENDLFIDASNDRIGLGTGSPSYGLHILNDAGMALEHASAGVSQIFKIEGSTDGGLGSTQATILMAYTDADYAGGAEQSAINMSTYKQSDASQWTSFHITAVENTDADAIVIEKQAAFSSNTTESHVAINGGIAYTQNYDISTSGDLDLDRSFYTINITGGVVSDTIKLPEVAQTTDNWSNSLTSTQCQVGQEYVITNARSGVDLRIGAYNPAGTSDDLIGTRTAPGGSAGSAITIPPGKSVIIKCYQLAGGIGYWNYWLSN